MTPKILEQYGPREAMEYDVVVVGGGPAAWPPPSGSSSSRRKGAGVSVVVLEKGSEPGAHILSGAVMDPRR
jgi:electron-transferring-flavoprotein dehydrogenase